MLFQNFNRSKTHVLLSTCYSPVLPWFFKAKGSMILLTKMRPKSQLATLYFEGKKVGKMTSETQSASWWPLAARHFL